MKIIILAAGIGSRLGNPFPKPLTPLKNGKTIMQQQVEKLTSYFSVDDITVIIGFKKDLIMESFPDLSYIYNQSFDRTNTSKSLLKGLKKYPKSSILWLNGDVVFDEKILEYILPYIAQDVSFVAVNNSEVGDEEIKYTLDEDQYIKLISKEVEKGLGEAVGINYIANKDLSSFTSRLKECEDMDYFEKGLELAIQKDHIKVKAVDISKFNCVEVDFEEDLENVNKLFSK